MRIAICDDEINIQQIIEGYIKNICTNKKIDFEVKCYSSGDELCENYQRDMYDIIFLDIEYEGKNGVEVGKYIREIIQDDIVQIAYISGNTEYALELFEYHPINFLIKPINEYDVEKVIDKYLRISGQKTEMFNFKIRKEDFKIPLSEIVYFSSRARKVTIHAKSDTYEFYDSLESIYSKIKGKNFLFVHKSFIINYRYIRRMGYKEVVLVDNTVIPISQSRRSIIGRQFCELKQREMK